LKKEQGKRLTLNLNLGEKLCEGKNNLQFWQETRECKWYG